MGQYIAGMGFSKCRTWNRTFCMAHALGAAYDTPHGERNAILSPNSYGIQCRCNRR